MKNKDPLFSEKETSAKGYFSYMEYLKSGGQNSVGSEGFFFNDGKRKIDFVLVYEDMYMSQSMMKRVTKWRQRFMSNLALSGLDIEEVCQAFYYPSSDITVGDNTIHYIKLSAPWYVLVTYAEELSLRAPLEVRPNPIDNWSKEVLKILRIPNIFYQDVPNKPTGYYTCTFKEAKMERFLGIENKDEFFTPVQRSRIVFEILQNSVYGKRHRAEVGIERLIDENVYTASFPLHDGPYEITEPILPEKLNKRQVLYEYWARWGRWYKYQPLNHIREYFGEKIAIYFAWLAVISSLENFRTLCEENSFNSAVLATGDILNSVPKLDQKADAAGFYTTWLVLPSIVGLLVFVYGAITVWSDIPTNEICQNGKAYKMCPICSEKEVGCNFWYLSEICLIAKIGYLFDQPASVFYSVFISFWAVTFLEYWKRKSVSLAHHWDCMGFEELEERPRPEFSAKATSITRNAITGNLEPTFSKRIRYQRMTVGAGVLMLMMVVVLIFVFAVIIYRLMVMLLLGQYQPTSRMASAIASITGAVLNLLCIMVMGRVYESIAAKLTDWEMHRTQTEHENHFTFKVFIFQFVNYYSSLFYVAFIKERFVGYPGHYTHWFGMRGESCGNSGCFDELALQLAVIMIGKQMINNAQEILIPKVKIWWHQRSSKLGKYSVGGETSRWSEDYQMISGEGLFQEYLEMVLQFGFITIFVVAFPLAPLFALLNNWMEIRLDAHKFVCQTRRSVAERAENIGVWFTILQVLAHLAVITNAFLIAFTSQYLPRLVYSFNYHPDLEGFVNFTLAWAPNGTVSEACRYIAFRDHEGNFTEFHWQLLGVRLAFIIIFEHIVFGICKLIDIIVPDIPESLDVKIKRNIYLAKQAMSVTGALIAEGQFEDEVDDDDKLEEPS